MARPAILSRSLLPRFVATVLLCALLLVGSVFVPHKAYGAEVTNRSLKFSTAEAGASMVTYGLQFDTTHTAIVGSFLIEFCDNTPLAGDPCSVPAGMDMSAAVIASQFGMTGFAITGATANELVLTRPPALEVPNTSSYNFINITNPANDGPLFARILLYSNSTATGVPFDTGGLAMVILPGFTVQAEVPPYITFCVGETITNFDCSSATEPFSDVGDLNANLTASAQSQVVVATNAENGYTLRSVGNTMTSGSNIINAMAGSGSVKGTAQFGINLRANTNPSAGQNVVGPGTAVVEPLYDAPNIFRFTNGDIIAGDTQGSDFRKFTITYIVNVPKDQPGGVYSTTITYVCLANF